MSLELIKEPIKINQVICSEFTQTIVENDIIVPDVKPDIYRVVMMDGEAFISSADAMQDRVAVNGVVVFKILYCTEDDSQSVKSINTYTNFSYNMDMVNTRQGMKCKVKCDVEHIEHNILNGRKINAKTIVKINCKVFEEISKEVVCGIDGADDLQVLKDNYMVNSYIGNNKINYIIKEALDVPAGKPTIMDILRNDVKISGKEYKIADNKIVVKGDLNISTLYVGDDENRSIQSMEHEIPFTQFIDLYGIDEDSACVVEYQVIDSRFDAGEDSDGELRVLNGEASINIFVEGYSKKEIEMVSDAYSPKFRLNLEKLPLSFEEIFSETKGQIALRESIVLPEDAPGISEVFNIMCKQTITECIVHDDKVEVEGVVNSNVLYLSDNEEQPVSCYRQDIPFKHSVDLKGIKENMGCDVLLDIEHSNYSMLSSNEVEVRLTMAVDLKVFDQKSLPLLVKALEVPLDEKRSVNQPSITIYFTQPGDTLWKVAKKYYTTVADIKRANNIIEREIINPGQQLIIPRRS